uniref:Uncharacterized protein n=1 Tax=Arundo donax TaxID=35708 RepID=A0A0A9AZ93_ARUDO
MPSLRFGRRGMPRY